MTPIPCVRAIITDREKRILLLKRANSKHEEGKWCLPGGKLDLGESSEQACLREIKEETGLEVKLNEFELLFETDELPIPGIATKHCITKYYLVSAEGRVTINSESSEYMWARPNQISSLN